jgi:hypothetical protein
MALVEKVAQALYEQYLVGHPNEVSFDGLVEKGKTDRFVGSVVKTLFTNAEIAVGVMLKEMK